MAGRGDRVKWIGLGPKQFAQQVRMFVQQPEQIDDGGHRRDFPALVPRQGVVTAACQTGRRRLGQAELAADAADFLALPHAMLQHQRIAGRRVAAGAVRIEHDFIAGRAPPTRQPLDGHGNAGVIHNEGLVLECHHVRR